MRLLSAALLMLFIVICFEQTKAQVSTSQVEQELKQITQQLLDGVTNGDKTVWEKFLADNCVYTDEEGNTLTKKELVSQLRPLPEGYKGSLKVSNPRAVVNDAAAVITYDALEDLEIFGQKIFTKYHTTDTYIKHGDSWQMIASQVTVIPSERKAVLIDSKALDAYVGNYQLASNVLYSVTRSGDKLLGQRTGRNQEELLPLNENMFFVKGRTRGEKIFVKDKQGKIIEMIDRRDNNDIVWKKVR